MGLTNCGVRIPFVRPLDEGRKVIEVLAKNGLVRGESFDGGPGLKLIMMCEVPSNALLADEFLEMFSLACADAATNRAGAVLRGW